eukprot:385084-Hanusia_phi.AAC.6
MGREINGRRKQDGERRAGGKHSLHQHTAKGSMRLGIHTHVCRPMSRQQETAERARWYEVDATAGAGDLMRRQEGQ